MQRHQLKVMKHIIISANLEMVSESQLRAIERIAVKHNGTVEQVSYMLDGGYFDVGFFGDTINRMAHTNEEQEAITNEIEMAIAKFN